MRKIIQKNFLFILILICNFPSHSKEKTEESDYILKIYNGKNSTQNYFKEKKIKLISKWENSRKKICKDIVKFRTFGKGIEYYKYGSECKNKRWRFVYYTDGTIVKELKYIKVIKR